ncbi:MAG: hypothetical protein HQK49_07460 [Oligoflexia bacterium]|nr:hypothetical protein [Oligoflexia bacterium]
MKINIPLSKTRFFKLNTINKNYRPITIALYHDKIDAITKLFDKITSHIWSIKEDVKRINVDLLMNKDYHQKYKKRLLVSATIMITEVAI